MKKEAKNIFTIIVEIPKNSKIKYEYDKKTQTIFVDRFLHGTNYYPGNYGFIPDTLELDGDAMDVLVWSTHPVVPGASMEVRVIGALGMVDDGEIDTKIIAVFVGDPYFQNIHNYEDLPPMACQQIADFFQNYKKLEKKKTIIKNWHGPEAAIKMIFQAQKRAKKQIN